MELEVLGGGAGMAGWKMVYGAVSVQPVWFNILLTVTITSLYPNQRNPCFTSLDQLETTASFHPLEGCLSVCVCVCVYTLSLCVYIHIHIYI